MSDTDKINKFAVIVHESANSVNIGDYIQALASAQFLPQVNTFLEREKIGEYDGDRIKVIMNAWYMYDKKQWPPSEKIQPLFIAMHINKTAMNIFSTKQSIDYLKKYSPIGCRDKATEKYIKSLGIKAYFSGCMTLTLGLKYKSDIHNGKVYFVDPAMPNIGKFNKQICLLFNYFRYKKKICNIFKKKYPSVKCMYKDRRRWLSTVAFYLEYRKLFDEDLIINAEYICQEDSSYKTNFKNHYERFIEAERLIKLYAKAKLVITSRIHCALPCTGLETPVIYTYQNSQDENSSCRMDGLLQLFNVVNIDKDGHIYTSLNFNSKNKISNNNLPIIKNEWKDLANEMIERCKRFINFE